MTSYRDLYIKICDSAHKATVKILNLYTPDDIASQCRKQKSIKL